MTEDADPRLQVPYTSPRSYSHNRFEFETAIRADGELLIRWIHGCVPVLAWNTSNSLLSRCTHSDGYHVSRLITSWHSATYPKMRKHSV